MSDTKAERLADALNDFISSSPDVEAAAVVSFDGLAMASALPPDMDEDRLGAMSAALLSLGEQAASGLGRGELSQVFVEGEHGYVFLMSARDQAVLAAVTSKQAKIGFMLFEMRRAADVIGELLERRFRDPRFDELAEDEVAEPDEVAEVVDVAQVAEVVDVVAEVADVAEVAQVTEADLHAPQFEGYYVEERRTEVPEPHEILRAMDNGHGASAPLSS